MFCNRSNVKYKNQYKTNQVQRGTRMSQKLLAIIMTATLSIAAHADFNQQIVGGVVAERGEFPFQVSLQRNNSHFCGGSLIKPNWVLTAAHCVGNSNMQIVAGLHDQKDRTGTETFAVKRIIPHPKYNRSTLAYDFALIELNGESAFRTADLNQNEIEIPEIGQDPINVITSGWGTTREGAYTLPDLLQKVEVPLVSAKECNAAASYNGRITDSMICAGLPQGGKDACQGDSGGPLFTKNASGDFSLVGVVSWGAGCARPNKFGVYSKVNAVIDWIATETQ